MGNPSDLLGCQFTSRQGAQPLTLTVLVAQAPSGGDGNDHCYHDINKIHVHIANRGLEDRAENGMFGSV